MNKLANLKYMKLLLLGSGGREHALAWKIAQSPKIEKLYVAPGNAGTSNVAENVAIKGDDFDSIRKFVLENGIDMVVVGPEDPLVKGIYDYFQQDDTLKEINTIKGRSDRIFWGSGFAFYFPELLLRE